MFFLLLFVLLSSPLVLLIFWKSVFQKNPEKNDESLESTARRKSEKKKIKIKPILSPYLLLFTNSLCQSKNYQAHLLNILVVTMNLEVQVMLNLSNCQEGIHKVSHQIKWHSVASDYFPALCLVHPIKAVTSQNDYSPTPSL